MDRKENGVKDGFRATLIVIMCLLCLLLGGCFQGHGPSATASRSPSPLILRLTPQQAVPIPPQQGRGAPIENLIPMYGSSYETDPFFADVVTAFRRWEWNVVYTRLDEMAREDPENLDIYRLQAEVYMINQSYKAALGQLDRVLEQNPEDLHALGVSAILMRILGDKAGEQERLAALERLHPQAAEAVSSLLARAEALFQADYSSEPQLGQSPEAIAVFGQTPKSDGTPSAGLFSRLEKALEMAQRFPEAKLILSGGDLKTEFTEAAVMADWLVEQGVSEERLILDEAARDTLGNAIGTLQALEEHGLHSVLIVGTLYHLPRAVTTMTIYAETQGYELDIDSAGGGQTAVKEEGERLYTYVLAARAGALFEKKDYDRFAS